MRKTPFIKQLPTSEAAAGILLMLSGATALVAANSPVAPFYFGALQLHVGGLSVLHWINDGLMSAFFLLVGLEIKREILEGHLASWQHRVLPGIAAVGGMIAPALIYIALNGVASETARGWAIPTATDIAFALGVLALLGNRVPTSLKVFLTALAILDDLGAIALIALFYSTQLSAAWLLASAGILVLLGSLTRTNVRSLAAYTVLGVLLWFAMLRSGIHATLAGVMLALFIPLSTQKEGNSPLRALEHGLKRWVNYLIVPIFGLANAGVSFGGMTLSALLAPVPLGVAGGLFLGKQGGVLLASWVAVQLNFTQRPEGTTWAQLYGVSLLCGIGFTMSLFIGLLAFPENDALLKEVKLGILVGSLLAGTIGITVLALATPRPAERP